MLESQWESLDAISKTSEISDPSKLAVSLSLHVRGNKSCAALECLIARRENQNFSQLWRDFDTPKSFLSTKIALSSTLRM